MQYFLVSYKIRRTILLLLFISSYSFAKHDNNPGHCDFSSMVAILKLWPTNIFIILVASGYFCQTILNTQIYCLDKKPDINNITAYLSVYCSAKVLRCIHSMIRDKCITNQMICYQVAKDRWIWGDTLILKGTAYRTQKLLQEHYTVVEFRMSFFLCYVQ